MSVTGVQKDPTARTMTITTEYDAPIERVWKLWSDPRQLERWWGPPTYPATVVDHDLRNGGRVSYYMTGAEGDRHGGWWRILDVDPPRSLSFEDGFSDEAGEPNPAMPTMVVDVNLEPKSGHGTRMAITTTFPSDEAMEQVLSMGAEEGMTAALGQIDAVLAAS
jgi:uncharacterized protein YndB with AHSA1/START domain